MRQELRILIVGLGNPILGDDGIGWRVADEVALHLTNSHIEVDSLALGGLSLMERLIGYDVVIIIDAIQTENSQIGKVSRFDLDDLPDWTGGHTTAVHDTSLQTALALGREMGAQLPERIELVTVEAARISDFTDTLTPAVETAITQAVQLVLDILEEIGAVYLDSDES